MKKLKVRQKLLLLGLLFATPFAAVVAYDLFFVKAPRDLGSARAEIAAVSVQTRLLSSSMSSKSIATSAMPSRTRTKCSARFSSSRPTL